MEAKLIELWRAEPVRYSSYLAAIVVFVAAKAGVVIDSQNLIAALVIVIPILLGGQAARREVIPVHSLVADYDQLPDDPINNPPVQTVKKDAA